MNCMECAELNEANGKKPDCANCGYSKEPEYTSLDNEKAMSVWHMLDLFGRGIDGMAGVPQALRIEAIKAECERYADADGLFWRVMLIEEIVFGKRLEKFKQESKKGT